MSCNFTAKCDEINDVYLEKMILQDFLWIFLMELKRKSCGTSEANHIYKKEVIIEMPSI